jgi:hypothetical protein
MEVIFSSEPFSDFQRAIRLYILEDRTIQIYSCFWLCSEILLLGRRMNVGALVRLSVCPFLYEFHPNNFWTKLWVDIATLETNSV